MKNTLSVLMLVLASLLAACAPAVSATPAPEESSVLSVFGAYATAIEEPWDGVIHSALQKAQSEGRITYEFTDDIGYAGDMERVLREVAEQKKPNIIFGDAFGNPAHVQPVGVLHHGDHEPLLVQIDGDAQVDVGVQGQRFRLDVDRGVDGREGSQGIDGDPIALRRLRMIKTGVVLFEDWMMNYGGRHE